MQCDHVGHRHYVERIFSNGEHHYGVQCFKCKRMVKLEGQKGFFIKFSEIPLKQRANIRDYIYEQN